MKTIIKNVEEVLGEVNEWDNLKHEMILEKYLDIDIKRWIRKI